MWFDGFLDGFPKNFLVADGCFICFMAEFIPKIFGIFHFFNVLFTCFPLLLSISCYFRCGFLVCFFMEVCSRTSSATVAPWPAWAKKLGLLPLVLFWPEKNDRLALFWLVLFVLHWFSFGPHCYSGF